MEEKVCKEDMAENLRGLKFGNLTAIERGENDKSGHVRWWCDCTCGNRVLVGAGHLKSGHTQSCGCLRIKIMRNMLVKNLTNKKFGKLLVTDKAYIKNGRQYWNCKCDCGATIITSSVSLTSGKKKSCGCLISAAEYELSQFLNNQNILFMQQYRFNDCKNEKCLPFDFAIFHPVNQKLMFLIELHGEQHYFPFTFCGENTKTKNENLDKRRYFDIIKTNYCKENHIPLLIVKYTNFDVKNEIVKKFYNKILSNGNLFEQYVYESQKVKEEFQLKNKHVYRRRIVQIDINERKIIKKYESIAEANRATGISTGALSDCCKKHKYKTLGGYAWAYDNDLDIDKSILIATTPNKTVAVSIYQKDGNGNIIKEWNSITEAANYFQVKHQNIQACCSGRQKTCRGFIWEYKKINV